MAPDLTDILARAKTAYDSGQYGDARQYLVAAVDVCIGMDSLTETLKELTAELDQRIESIRSQ